ncbi:hypothetical protein PG994_001009 [Apiospora phragmitis]|uniref:Uncharacterized protein n=1 Tax=Apiospora phragmitis TaxID=2905665 RepID=A0ABR1WR85_9PEZI
MPRYKRFTLASEIKKEDIKEEHASHSNIKQETVRRQRRASYPGYDWDFARRTANEKARSEGIAELPVSRVGRVMQDGKLTSLFDTNLYGKREFIAYDGFDVLACVQDSFLLDAVIYDLAKLHIGTKAESNHPGDVDLVVQSEIMEDDEGSFSGWAIFIQPEVVPGKKRKSTETQKQGKQVKRRAYN